LCGEFVDMIKELLPEELFRFEAMSDNGIDFWILEASKTEKDIGVPEGMPDHLAGYVREHGWQPEAPKRAKSFFVAEEKPGHLTGFIQGHVEDQQESVLNRWGVIDALFIEEAQRGQGLGSELCKTLEQWFAGQDCVAARVETWMANTPALEAYKAMGFIPFHTGFVKEI
jgi:GNAT superfamily N-acetyltransferase